MKDKSMMMKKALFTFLIAALAGVQVMAQTQPQPQQPAKPQGTGQGAPVVTPRDTPGTTHPVKWYTLEEALELQKKAPKKILIDAYTHWCGPCKKLKNETLANANVAKYINDNFYAVAFDCETPDTVIFKGVTYTNPEYVPNKQGRNGVNQFSRFLGVMAYPTLVFMDEKANIVDRMVGYKTPSAIQVNLFFVAEEAYKTHNTPEKRVEYETSFKPTW
jgi:thioredoxin-related protein